MQTDTFIEVSSSKPNTFHLILATLLGYWYLWVLIILLIVIILLVRKIGRQRESSNNGSTLNQAENNRIVPNIFYALWGMFLGYPIIVLETGYFCLFKSWGSMSSYGCGDNPFLSTLFFLVFFLVFFTIFYLLIHVISKAKPNKIILIIILFYLIAVLVVYPLIKPTLVKKSEEKNTRFQAERLKGEKVEITSPYVQKVNDLLVYDDGTISFSLPGKYKLVKGNSVQGEEKLNFYAGTDWIAIRKVNKPEKNPIDQQIGDILVKHDGGIEEVYWFNRALDSTVYKRVNNTVVKKNKEDNEFFSVSMTKNIFNEFNYFSAYISGINDNYQLANITGDGIVDFQQLMTTFKLVN